MAEALPWSKWDSDTHHNGKLLAVSPAARWLYFAVAQECRLTGKKDGRLALADVKALAEEQGVPRAAVKELLTLHAPHENPLWRAEGDVVAVHDFDSTNPPTSTARVKAWRVKRRRQRAAASATLQEPAIPPTPPSPAPPSPTPPRDIEVLEDDSQNQQEGLPERVAAVSEWWHRMSGEYPLAKHVEAIAAIEAPIEKLLAHLDTIYQEENVVGLAYYTSGPGMGRLHELESGLRRRKKGKPARPTALRDLVKGYAGERASTAS